MNEVNLDAIVDMAMLQYRWSGSTLVRLNRKYYVLGKNIFSTWKSRSQYQHKKFPTLSKTPVITLINFPPLKTDFEVKRIMILISILIYCTSSKDKISLHIRKRFCTENYMQCFSSTWRNINGSRLMMIWW